MRAQRITKIIDACVIIRNEFMHDNDLELLFLGENVIVLGPESTVLDILVATGICQSKGQARKTAHLQWLEDNGKLSKKIPALEADVPPGFNEFSTGKLKHWVAIWHPAN